MCWPIFCAHAVLRLPAMPIGAAPEQSRRWFQKALSCDSVRPASSPLRRNARSGRGADTGPRRTAAARQREPAPPSPIPLPPELARHAVPPAPVPCCCWWIRWRKRLISGRMPGNGKQAKWPREVLLERNSPLIWGMKERRLARTIDFSRRVGGTQQEYQRVGSGARFSKAFQKPLEPN